eukprot:CAMPEP_0177692476 /NCGR_PEP_ID=MMETSP0484_2-20121128/1872_1 /TAXON_ID=354590 /ORGANISM="Rhodomonas lens, Strain RHODO" /LENGTH=367 /DNA_ID=CAMNT_0019203193 /DNA_START=109 /DNA_END=1209 /DNA_ORIENTATION=+
MTRGNNSTRDSRRGDEAPPFYENPRLDQLSPKVRAPRWTFGGRTKHVEEIYASQTPGPGAYSPGSSGYKPPAFSLYGRLQDKNTSFAPGPGAYSHDGAPRKRIAVSLQSRNFPPDGSSTTPGPGQYKQDMPSTSPRYSLGGRLNDPYAKLSASTPGPAQYNPEKPRVNRATRLHGRVQDIDKRGNMPGPGAYGNPDMTRVKTRPPAFSLGGRPQTANSGGLGPGPGNYNPRKPGTSLAYSMTPRREGGAWTTNKQQPGPGAYSPYDSTSAGAGMGIGPRFNYSDKLGPGPGAYQPNLNKGSPAYTMTARRSGDFGGRRMQPGPGAYSPKTEFVLSSSPRCSLHSRLNTPAANLNTPGPNHYNAVRPN